MKNKDDLDLLLSENTQKSKRKDGVDVAGAPYIIHPLATFPSVELSEDTSLEDYVNNCMLQIDDDLSLVGNFSSITKRKAPKTTEVCEKKVFETNALFWQNPPHIIEAIKVKNDMHEVRFEDGKENVLPVEKTFRREKKRHAEHRERNNHSTSYPLHSEIKKTLSARNYQPATRMSEEQVLMYHALHAIGFGGMCLLFIYAGILMNNGYIISTTIGGLLFYTFYSFVLEYVYMKMHLSMHFSYREYNSLYTSEIIAQEVRSFIKKQTFLSLVLAIGINLGWKFL